jgi:phage tail protein X
MKTVIRNILIGVMLLVSAGQAFAYPPDNAAVLYYRAFMLMEEPNDALGNKLAAVRKGEAKPDDQVRRYVERNRRVIREAVAAADISHCDWGHDLSEGLSLQLPELAKCKHLGSLLVVDARILAEQGDTKTALERCLALHEMGRHIGSDTLVHRLVGIGVSGLANKCIVDILPRIAGECETLEWLKVRLTDVSSRCPSMKEATAKEAEVDGHSINREGILYCIEGDPCDLPKDKRDQILQVLQENDEFFARAREYFQSVMARMQSAFDLPYAEAMQEFKDLHQEVEKAVAEKSEAKITMFLFPAINRVLMIDTRSKTQFNAVLAGIEIYIIRAKTGKLPDELPAGLPKDMFSGKDFLYEKTDAGFVLNGQDKDLDKDIVKKYEFKVAK